MKKDVIIVGGGPNGLGLALALAGRKLARPLAVTVVDARSFATTPHDPRGTAITRSTQNMFEVLGLWPTLAPDAAEMRNIIVTNGKGSHQDRPSLLRFATDDSQKAASTIVENGKLNAALLHEVLQSPMIELVGGFSVADVRMLTGKIEVISKQGEKHSSALLVAADGRHSAVREHRGIPVSKQDYGQTALSFSIGHTEPHNNTAEEHFSPDGVFAVLPLVGKRSSIIWGTSTGEAARLMSLDDKAFADALQVRMGHRLGEVHVEGTRGSYPLVMQIAESFIAPRTALLGDAAHAIHPLAGLGLNLGFKDAAALADCLAQAIARGEDLGGPAMLERYQVRRRFDTTMTAMMMDVINTFFANDNRVLSALRSTGLRLVDQFQPAKSFLMQQAAGLSEDNPRLLRGLLPG